MIAPLQELRRAFTQNDIDGIAQFPDLHDHNGADHKDQRQQAKQTDQKFTFDIQHIHAFGCKNITCISKTHANCPMALVRSNHSGHKQTRIAFCKKTRAENNKMQCQLLIP